MTAPAGDEGDDTIDRGPGAQNFAEGNVGGDTITGGNGRNFMGGGNGNNALLGGNGGDGGADDDLLLGAEGDDRLKGGDGDDTVGGNAGDDGVDGVDGDDQVSGGSGDDILLGRAGVSTYDCGSGTDLAHSTAKDVPLPDICDQRGGQATQETVGAKVKLQRKNNGKKRVKRVTAKVAVECPAAQDGSCEGTVKIKNGDQAVTRTRRYSIEPGETANPRVRFKNKAGKLLNRSGLLFGTAVTKTGLPGGTTATSKSVTIVS